MGNVLQICVALKSPTGRCHIVAAVAIWTQIKAILSIRKLLLRPPKDIQNIKFTPTPSICIFILGTCIRYWWLAEKGWSHNRNRHAGGIINDLQLRRLIVLVVYSFQVDPFDKTQWLVHSSIAMNVHLLLPVSTSDDDELRFVAKTNWHLKMIES